MLATNFDTRNEFVTFNMSSRVNKSGRFAAEWKFDPKDVMEMELDYEIHNFLISDISPYSFHNTAYPLFHGDMVYTGFIDIHNREIVSENHLHIEDIEAGKKVFDNPPYKIPVRLAVALLRDMHGDIDLDIKVRGNVDDPKFNYWGLLGQVLKNLLVKAVTAPFRLLARAFKVDEESLKGINWLYGQSILFRD